MPSNRQPTNTQRRCAAQIAAAAIVVACFASRAGGFKEEPAAAESSAGEVRENLDAQVPLELEFTRSDGQSVTLGQFFDGARPVILTLNYSDCPSLCSLQLNGLVEGLSGLDWDVGPKFQVVTVSIDPKETPERAQETKERYLKIYGRAASADGWHFLVGPEENVRRLADTVGFHYQYVPQSGQYAHDVVLMICTPAGRVSRYLYGFEYDPKTMRMALLEAAQGRIGTTTERILLFCYHFDPAAGRYSVAAFRLMQLGAALTVVVLGGALAVFWRRERRKPRSSQAMDQEQST